MFRNDLKLKKIYCIALMAVTAITVLSFVWWKYYPDAMTQGINLNRRAWETSYVERGVSIPPSGPREGYWGARLGKKIRDSRLGWHEPEIYIPGLLEIDKNGQQHYKASGPVKYTILIIGGSVAFGAYASEISKTYFNIIGTVLDSCLAFSDITIFASGAWKSIQELKAFQLYRKNNHPDLVVFLNGLNDITNGATSKTLYGEKVQPADGSSWSPLYHAHDYTQRVSDYLVHMDVAWEISKNSGSDMLVVLQPSLTEREHKTKIEETLLKGSLKPHASVQVFNESYASIRNALFKRSANEGFHFLDCSRSFNSEQATTFADLWHFSDYGHQILGNVMSQKISVILQKRTGDYAKAKCLKEPSAVRHQLSTVTP